MMGEKLTTAQIKPRHEVKTSPTTRLPKGTMPCCVLPGFAPPPHLEREQTQVPPLLDDGTGAFRLGSVIYRRKPHEG